MEIAEHIQRDDEETPLHADLQVSLDFPFIVYPYGMQKVDAEGNVVFLHSESTGKYRTEINGRSDSLSAYEIEFVEPDYSLKALRETQMQDYGHWTNRFRSICSCPMNCRTGTELAESITEEQDSVYEKVKAIERYSEEMDLSMHSKISRFRKPMKIMSINFFSIQRGDIVITFQRPWSLCFGQLIFPHVG